MSIELAVGDSVTATSNAASVYFVPAANFHGTVSFDYASVDDDAAAAYRAQLSNGSNAFVAGMLASLTPAKGHATAIRAHIGLAHCENAPPAIRGQRRL